MSSSSNTMVKLIGLILLVAGIALVFWGYQLSGAITARITKGLTGAMPDAVMYRYIGGAISSMAGLFLLTRR